MGTCTVVQYFSKPGAGARHPGAPRPASFGSRLLSTPEACKTLLRTGPPPETRRYETWPPAFCVATPNASPASCLCWTSLPLFSTSRCCMLRTTSAQYERPYRCRCLWRRCGQWCTRRGVRTGAPAPAAKTRCGGGGPPRRGSQCWTCPPWTRLACRAFTSQTPAWSSWQTAMLWWTASICRCTARCWGRNAKCCATSLSHARKTSLSARCVRAHASSELRCLLA